MLKRILTWFMAAVLMFALCSCGSSEEVVVTDAPEPGVTLAPDIDIPSGDVTVENMKTISEMDDLETVSGNFRNYVDSKGIDDTDYIYDDTFDYVQSMPADTSDENLKLSFNVTQGNYERYTLFSLTFTVTGDVAEDCATVVITDGITTVEMSEDDVYNYGTEDQAEYCVTCEMLDPESEYGESLYYADLVKIFESGNDITVTVYGENATNSGTVSERVRTDFTYINDIYAHNRVQYLK